jgi:site-specific recombinase XerD
VQQFLDYLRVQRNRPATTVRGYRQELAKFVAFRRAAAGEFFAPGITTELLRRYQLELADVMPNPRSRARALVALRQFLSYAYDQRWTAEELSRSVVVPRYVVGDPHPIASERVPELLASLPHDTLLDLRDRALVFFLLASGCRIGEACRVDWADVRPGGFRVLGKGGRHRTVYLTGDALKAVREYLERRGADGSPALFINLATRENPGGHPAADNRLTPDGARWALGRLRARSRKDGRGLTAIAELRTPHVARHTAATTLLEATDGDARLVQEVLGHQTLETLRVYTEITDKRKRRAYDRLEEYLGEIVEEGSRREAGPAPAG